MSKRIPGPFRNKAFRSTIINHPYFKSKDNEFINKQSRRNQTADGVTGHVWEGVLADGFKAHAATRKRKNTATGPVVEWDPTNCQSGVDMIYQGIGYSCKGVRYEDDGSSIVVTPSYRMFRCASDADAILEIDRPHRHNFDWYALLARRSLAPVDVVPDPDKYLPMLYDLYLFPSDMTKSAKFSWDKTSPNNWETEWKGGVQLCLRARRLYIKWDTSVFVPVMSFKIEQGKNGLRECDDEGETHSPKITKS